MNNALAGKTIAIVEHRHTAELATLFERQGALVWRCPLVEEQIVEDKAEVQRFIRSVIDGAVDMAIFLTGVGFRLLVAEAEALGEEARFLGALRGTIIVVRGPKPVRALKERNLRVDITPALPTSEGILEALNDRDLQGKRIWIQLYGIPNPMLVNALTGRGAVVTAVRVYSYAEASSAPQVEEFMRSLAGGSADVLAFTSAPQVRFLMKAARGLGLEQSIVKVLRNGTIVAAVGDVTRRALNEAGLEAAILPREPKMGALVNAVCEFFVREGV